MILVWIYAVIYLVLLGWFKFDFNISDDTVYLGAVIFLASLYVKGQNNE